jgi:exodeoxyribonuclease VII small subunit
VQDKLAFEAAMKRLEEVVDKLEKGEVPLEQALSLFEEGVRLSRLCREKLDEAEKRVELLLKDEAGMVYKAPFSLTAPESTPESEPDQVISGPEKGRT